MFSFSTIPSVLLFLLLLPAPDPLTGAWAGEGMMKGEATEVVVIFTPEHQVAVWYVPATGAVMHTNGGLWMREGIRVTETVHFDSDRPARVGSTVSFDIALTPDSLAIVGSPMQLTRVDAPREGGLTGAWEWVDGETGATTVRLMSATRFQEITYRPETGVMEATSGGRYQLNGGTYAETVLFTTADAAVAGQRPRVSGGRCEP